MVQSSRRYFSLGSPHFRFDDRALIIQRFQLPSRYGRFDETIHAGNFSSFIQQAVGGLPREELDRHRVLLIFVLLFKMSVNFIFFCFRGIAYKMINLLQDLDELLQTGKKFLLGKWIADAKSWGTTEGVCLRLYILPKIIVVQVSYLLLQILQEKLQYEWNARNQITLWGPRGEIRDYAAKQWAGVVADYYKPRWEVFIREMQMSLDENRAFNKKAYETLVFTAVEEPFTTSTKHYPDVPIGKNGIVNAIANKTTR